MAARAGIRRSSGRAAGRLACLACLGSVLLAACSSGSSTTATSFNPASPVPTTSTTVPGGGSPSAGGATSTTAAPAALVDAIVFYETSHTIPRSAYRIANVQLSRSDPSWAKFTIDPTPADESSLQAGYGIAHLSDGNWSIVGFGSAEVGCPPGPSVPPDVLSSLGLSCPSS